MSQGELQRFVQRFGLDALIDRSSRRYEELGLRTAQPSQSRWFERLEEEPRLLVMPLVRRLGQPPALTIGLAEKTWQEWAK